MSLLMDALRKAEQQKQKLSTQGAEVAEFGTQAADSPQTGLALEPISRKETPNAAPASSAFSASGEVDYRSSLPELPSSLEALDEQFLAHAAQSKPAPTPRPVVAPPPSEPNEPVEPVRKPSPPPAQTKPVPSETARDSVRNVFDAKQPQPRNNRNFAVAIGLISLVAAIGIGAYFWWQLQPKGNMMVAQTPPPPASATPPVIPPPPVTPSVTQAAVPPAPTLSSPSSSPIVANQEQDEEEADTPPPPRREIKPPRPAPLPAASEPESPVRKTTTAARTDPQLIKAHEAFGRGEVDVARAAWQKVLTGDPRNLDALRGLAVLAQQDQQVGEAVSYYQRALEVDPKDAIAFAGLMALRAPTDMLQAESRLKTLLAEQPDSPHLHFALGNQFARQQRWAEAQQSFFKAYSVEARNPDYAFNLAVSLDQLHQPKLAARYYNEALATAERQPGQPSGFNPADVINRLKQLQAATAP